MPSTPQDRRATLVWAALLAVPITGCSGGTRPADLGPILVADGWVEVPFSKGADGLPVVDGTVAGEKVLLLLDTGAATLALDAGVADRLHLEVGAADKRAVGLGAGISARSTRVQKLAVGSFDAGQVTAVVLDLGTVNKSRTRRGDRPVDGVIGADFLDAHQAVIDFAAGRIYLRPRAAGARTP